MTSNSDLFDSIRVKPNRGRKKKAEPVKQACEHPGCLEAGTHKAPKGRGREGEYYHFCVTHVRDYNKTYNYFNGMADEAVSDFQKDAMTGHRPTWKMGDRHANKTGAAQARATARAQSGRLRDPHNMFDEEALARRARSRKMLPLEQKAYDTLDLDASATKQEIKTRYKELVKRHHPDANGGDRGSEERLRQIISAYNTLKNAGKA